MIRTFVILSAVMACGVLPASETVIHELNLPVGTNAVIMVGMGDVLHIDKITGKRGTITKTGEGTLCVKRLLNRNVSLDVKEGRLFFDRQMPRVCADAFFHVDASRADTLELEERNGTNFVSRWSDVRGNGLFATNCLSGPSWRYNPESRRAFISDVRQNGLPVVDFGPIMFKAYTNAVGEALGYGATMIWSKTCTNVHEVYEVISDTPEVATIPNDYPQFKDKDGIWATSFLSSSLDRAGNYRERLGSNPYPNVFYDNSNNNGWLFGGVYHNGALKSPNAYGKSGKFSAGAGFQLLGFTTREQNAEKGHADYAARLNSFARDYNTTFGGQRLAEYLVFTNRLDSADRTSLQNYLNSKWRGGASPPYIVSSLTVAPGAEVVFAPGVSVKAANITAGSDLTVENGSFELNALNNPDAYFHVDADAAATLALESENGTNFVTRWEDALSNGVYAAASTKTFGNWLPDPGNRKPFISEERLNNRSVVDFGPLQVHSHTNETGYGIGYGASMKWTARMSSSARELFTVVRDTDDVKTLYKTGNVKVSEFGQAYICDPDSRHGFRGSLRENGWPYISHDNKYNVEITTGKIYVDGCLSGWKTTTAGAGFHVFNFHLAPCTGVLKPGYFAYSYTKTNDRYVLGGTKIAEYLVFDHPLTNSVRDEIYSALRTKWFAEARALQTFGDLTLGTGVKVSFPWKDVAVTNCLTTGGDLVSESVTAAALRLTAPEASVSGSLSLDDGAAITVEQFQDGRIASLSAKSLSLAGGGTVAFSIKSGQKPAFGEWPILTYEEFSGSFEDWTFDTSSARCVSVCLKVKDDGLYAVVSPKGTVFLVR